MSTETHEGYLKSEARTINKQIVVDEYDAEQRVSLPFWETKVRFTNGILLGWVLTLLALGYNAYAGDKAGVALAVLTMAVCYFAEQHERHRRNLMFGAVATCAASWACWITGAM